MGPDRERDRLNRRARRLDRIATYGLPEPRRQGELTDRAATLEELADLVPAPRLLQWKLRSTFVELARRVVLESRSDPSTLPAAVRLLLVSVSTGVISALAADPASALVDHRDAAAAAVFLGCQAAAGVLTLWIVAILLRHPDHLPLRPLALPHTLILLAMAGQAVTNAPVRPSDSLYRVSCIVYVAGLAILVLAGWGAIRPEPARWGYRLNAVASALVGLNVFDAVNDTYGTFSIAGAAQVLAIGLGVTGALMLSRLPFRREVPPPAASSPLPFEPVGPPVLD